jgi:hypothetical protein
MWTVLAQAHAGSEDDAAAARRLLVERYGPAVEAYLRTVVGEPDAADLAQQFALELVRGGFRQADRARGRFRNYVKAALFHLVSKYRKAERRRPRPLTTADIPAPTAADEETAFDRTWRATLLDRAWATLEQAHPVGFLALRLRTDGLGSTDLAAELTERVGKPFTAAGARQQLHRARERFASFLLDAVVHSLADPSPANVEEELRDLDLLVYCGDALQRYRGE